MSVHIPCIVFYPESLLCLDFPDIIAAKDTRANEPVQRKKPIRRAVRMQLVLGICVRVANWKPLGWRFLFMTNLISVEQWKM